MGFTIHEVAAKKQMNWNVGAPQEAAPDPLPENWQGTRGGGLPVKQIPHLEYPRIVYMHPNEPYVEVKHKNDRHEVVSTEYQPTEHMTKAVNNERELEAALAQGWVKEPYIPEPAPTENPNLYGPKKKARTAA